ncbi:hypothetical protein JCM8097_006671 [Rhodosporidiobolus ruineniae]
MEPELTHMDRLTQTQNSIDDLVRIIYSTLSYLSRKASFKQLNPNFPVTQAIPGAEPPDVFEQNRKELVTDFLRKAKQLDFLIDALPGASGSTGEGAPVGEGGNPDEEQERRDEHELKELEDEMRRVNEDYLEALGEAETLHKQLDASLRGVLETRSGSANAATAACSPPPAAVASSA